MTSTSRGLRRLALEKIAVLAATQTPSSVPFEQSDFYQLCKGCSHHVIQKSERNSNNFSESKENIPMNIREFEVLLALCKAAPLLTEDSKAEKLVLQLSPYLLEAPSKSFAPSPFFRDIEPSPIEALSSHLTTALLSLAVDRPFLRDKVTNDIWSYLDRCQEISLSLESPNIGSANEIKDAIEVAAITMSILGFLDAAAKLANFWSILDRSRLIRRIRLMVSEGFLVIVETAFSTIRNSRSLSSDIKEWKKHLRYYTATGRPLGAMLVQKYFIWLVVASTSLLTVELDTLKGKEILDLQLSETKNLKPTPATIGFVEQETIETFANIAVDEINLLEDGADYLRIGSTWQQRLAFSVKEGALICYLNCLILNENAAEVEILMSWLEVTLSDPVQMADERLASVVLRSLALISNFFSEFAPIVSRLLPRFIVQSSTNSQTIAIASSCLAYVLQLLSPDATITTIYTLQNVLSSGATSDKTSVNLTAETSIAGGRSSSFYRGKSPPGSSISLAISTEEESSIVYGNVVEAICSITSACNDPKITALAQSMLLQKIYIINKAIDVRIITETSGLALRGGPLELRSLLKLYAKITTDGIMRNDEDILFAILKGRNHLSSSLRKDSPLFEIYFRHLLEEIISKGDIHQVENSREADLEFAAREIAQLLQPLAILMSNNNLALENDLDEDILSLVRDSWFNIVVHGFAINTNWGKNYLRELRIIAIHSKPLVAEQRGEQVESDIELNTVLRRGSSPEYETKQKQRLSALLPSRTSEIRGLSYRKVIFLHAVYLLETLRANTGDCTKALTYFLEPSMRKGDMSITMEAITSVVMDIYLKKALTGTNQIFSASCVSKQLALIFSGCCYRIDRVQQAAVTCADRIISDIPSALCQKYSLFALLELLTLMWTSCLQAETDEYEWKSSFTLARGNVTVELSDDFELRRHTLNKLYMKAKVWVTNVINIAPLDVKGLLQTYLSEYDDDGAYGHISLGRSFAIEMGSLIPTTDQRLGAINRHGGCNINTASDFIAQYTTRQEYRYPDSLPDHGTNWLEHIPISQHRNSPNPDRVQDFEDAATTLITLDAHIREHKYICFGDIRNVLRRAAALLYRAENDQCVIVHHLVRIPFNLFTKTSIKLGISLWLGVMNENPRMESRLLMEIAQHWEETIHRRVGLFNSKFLRLDPFFVKMEFAPSDRAELSRKAQIANNLLAPHMKLIQFFGSHFNATRLGSPNTERIFLRILEITLDEMEHATPHPLAREIRFQIILLGLKILRYCIRLDPRTKSVLKDRLLSAALTWFHFPPCWSFGGNRLHLKAESRLLTDISKTLRTVELRNDSVSASRLKSIQLKESLLNVLIESEKTRIGVWLHPVNEPQATSATAHLTKGYIETTLLGLINTAWTESSALAIQMLTRFPSVKLYREVRSLLLNFPERSISDPAAIHCLLGDNLPDDVSSQLKYLLYWAPVNPVSAISYFSPAYRNDPYILQYAMRALDSHPVDVTFFYVPQIVQTLRYDELGYVEKYIVETAKLSQFFAHQIIWNMKANAYKDEESQIPDLVKPKLDKVMNRMIAEFPDEDKDFYQREFAFFDQVTSISGKLKPYIKRPKPEKKQKIEEELRKIKVDVGVYLPSNPDGVVIGIDRTSGKPLQSHAKAPYMATFRIKKEIVRDSDKIEEDVDNSDHTSEENSIETWQSAIFKVGDDCRQDVLALQMISAFRGIFNSVGLDVYVFPYRVTATAPGCGVIDVLPNSISRDMLGREAVNGLYDYFVSKYGNEDSLRFQQARSNFVKSMAAYSIISFLLQFKDRHNGNIMIDDTGHILHIDFGFCFDIAPGGVKFERAPFKLTTEMMAVMGGNIEHQAFKWFEELCIKAFLVSRQYAEQLSRIVLLMMDSGLPCFKLETIKNFRERFVLEKTEREAAEFMKGLIKASYRSYSTGVYDQFQLLTNGIPY
ncbi:Phosphatidylinositol 4-kinase [Podosphaera aphanis]|nr:Phosphatidylinositol 4-kinase [Podosphaera aphanis]